MSQRFRGRRDGRRSGTWLLAAAVAVFAAIAGGYAAAGTKAADPMEKVEKHVVTELAGSGETTFWVYLQEQASLEPANGMSDRTARGRFVHQRLVATANRSQAGLRAHLRARGAEHQPFWIVNAIKVTGDHELLEEIAARPEVEQITADRVYELPEPREAEAQELIQQVEWGLANIRANEAWAEFGARGGGIVVGSIDTGVLFNHAALVNQYRGNNGDGTFDHDYNWHDPSRVCGNPSLVPCDNHGHGTHVTGTMVGDDGGTNRIGVAPEAKWISAKGCESSSCSQSALLSSGQFILAPTDLQGQNPDPDRRPHIVNNSWGGGANNDPWYQATVNAWVAAGIFPQFANGNDGPGCSSAGNPGNSPPAYAAGAYDVDNVIASFSSRGPSAFGGTVKPDIAAPGVAIRSSWSNGAYNTISGTSMASPHVSGVVALMWSAAPELQRDVARTRSLLDATARDMAVFACGGTPAKNNTWGEGRLDAFDAVDESPRPSTGTLAGAVADAGTGDPIAGATLRFEGPVDRVRTTNAAGQYAKTLAPGDYEVRVSRFGYLSDTKSATVHDGQTATLDFALERAPSAEVSGTVTDATPDGHTWPLYAKVTVVDTPEHTYTDPLTGEYSLTLPQGASYELVVEPQYPGYATRTVTVDLGEDDVTAHVGLIVDRCGAAPGYEFAKQVGVLGDHAGDPLVRFLDGEGIAATPLSWTSSFDGYDVIIINRPGTPPGGAPTFLNFLNATDAAGTSVIFLDTDFSGTGIWLLWQYTGNPATRSSGFTSAIPMLTYQVTETHPILEGYEVGNHVPFDLASTWKDHAWFGGYAGEGRRVIANASRSDLGVRGPGVGIQERPGGNRHVLLSMHASSSSAGPRHWTPEAGELFLNALSWAVGGGCETVDGGLVLGHVRDGNTGEAIDGATVASDADPDEKAVSAPTPDDPALDDGFYWLFSSATGSQSFTARRSAANYQPAATTVNVVADATNAADFDLGAGRLVATPGQVEATVALGESATRTVTIRNTGTAPAQVRLSKRTGSFEVLGPDGPGAEVRTLDVPVTDLSLAAAGDELGKGGDGAPASVPPWQSIANYPSPIMDNIADVWDGKVYSVAGMDGRVFLRDLVSYDPATGQWTQLAPIPTARQKPNGAIIGGKFYVVGGWDSAGGTVPTLEVYDIASNSWSTAAPVPIAWAASASVVLDGKLYLVGGCQAACGTNQVWVYDPGGNAWSRAKDYPEPARWTQCGAITGRIYCAGSSQPSASAYVYDPGADEWTPIAPVPKTVWAAGYVAANGKLLISGGVVDGNVSNEGFAYDPESNSWESLPPSNNAFYRGAAACGFYRIGGASSVFAAKPNAEVLPGYDDCGQDVDLAWLDASPSEFTLAPGASRDVVITLIATPAAGITQPGAYTPAIVVHGNTPTRAEPIAVTMHVTRPKDWGKVGGTVTGTDCQGNTAPLQGAQIQADGKSYSIPLSTGAHGTYAFWASQKASPLTIIASKDGWTSQSVSKVRINQGKTTTVDFNLRPTRC